MGVDVDRCGGEDHAAVTAHAVDPILLAGLERLDQPRRRPPLVAERAGAQEAAQCLRIVEHGHARGSATMRRFDHARVTELGDRIVKLECGPNLTVRGDRDTGGAHHSLHQRLVAEVERVVGLLPGIPRRARSPPLATHPLRRAR